MFAERYASATLAAVPSCAAFRLSPAAFQFHLRVRLRLPCLVAPFPRRLASDIIYREMVRQDMHDAARDSLLSSCAHSDLHVCEEPHKHYSIPGTQPVQYTKPDGVVQQITGTRIAFDTFVLQHPSQHASAARTKTHGNAQVAGHLHPVLAKGDRFFAAGFSAVGSLFPSARRLVSALTHTGDNYGHHVPGPRFAHDAQTWATPTHRAFMVHHAAVTVARAAWHSVRRHAAKCWRWNAAANEERTAWASVVHPRIGA